MPDNTWTLPAQYPVVLLPVRLETRFTATQLLVRVYPDEVHLDSHEAPLTDDEATWGKRYWSGVWAAAGDDAKERAAWEELATRYGAERASWVARVLEPTNPEARPGGTPAFPVLGAARASSWTQRTVARAMPTRWRVIGYPNATGVARQEVVGLPVPRPLPVGPAPTADLDSLAADQPPVDDATRWLVDFTAAEAIGMGVRLPRAPGGSDLGYQRVVVHGVVEAPAAGSTEPVAEVTGRELAALLDSHFHTRGVGFIAPGSATNNTATATSTHSRRDPESRAALRVRHGDAAPAAANSAAKRLAGALGIPLTATGGTGAPKAGTPTALGRARGAARDDESTARAMATALWAATGGYTLHQLAAGRFTDADVRGVREHLRSHVRPGGPLPALRIGKQPYGVLPVLPLNAWTEVETATGPRLNPAVAGFLRTLRDQVWRPAAQNPAAVPRVVRGAQDAERVVARVLAMSPTARRVFARSSLGQEYVTALWRLGTVALSEQWRAELGAAGAALAQRFGLGAFDVRLTKLVHARESFPLDAPWTLAAPGTPGGTPAQYLALLGDLSRGPESLRDAPDLGPAAATPLLYRLIRHSLLAEVGITTGRLLGDATGAGLEPELIDLDGDGTTSTASRRLSQFVPGSYTTISAWLRTPAVSVDARSTDLAEAAAAVRQLAGTAPADLERALAGQLDATSHRLDAWITSLATRRLGWLRRASGGKPTGAHLGGYGWVTDVRPRGTQPTPVTALPPGEAGPLVQAPGDTAGPIHAPSQTHAVTAAVLRSAQRAHGDTPGTPLAIDLTSERARAALWVLDGVRQGVPLGALLGARVERWIRDSAEPTLSSCIDALRGLAPVLATSVDADGAITESRVPESVVDGLALHRRYLDGRLDPLRDVGAAGNQVAELAKVFERLDDLVDAVADALLVEGVHQAVQGNPLRAGATLDAMSSGEAPPPELESLRTPRTGDAVTHRVAVLVGGSGPSPADWPTDTATQVRALAEPALAGWVARLLPRPGSITATAALPDHTLVPFTLAELRLSPLDWLALAPADPLAPLAGTDLEAHLLLRAAALPAVAGRRVTGVSSPGLPALLEAARAARDLVRSARAVRPADLTLPENADDAPLDLLVDYPPVAQQPPVEQPPEDKPPADQTPPVGDKTPSDETPPIVELPTSLAAMPLPSPTPTPGPGKPLPGPGKPLPTPTPDPVPYVSPTEMQDRLAAVQTVVNRTAEQLGSTALDTLRAGLLGASLLGVPGVVPPPPAAGDTDRGVLSALAAAALAELRRRAQAAAKITEGLGEEVATGRLGALVPDVPALPPFTLRRFTPTTADAFRSSYYDSTGLQAGDPTTAATRLLGVAKVRPGVDRLVTSLGYAEALGTGDGLTASVAQLPYKAGDRWAGLPAATGGSPGNRLAFTLHAPDGLPDNQGVRGLVVEEWTEVVPRTRETTGLAVHADSPDSAPPQAILLAVPPDGRADWDPQLLTDTVDEALSLAQLRAVDLEALHPVDPDALTDIGQLLPATVLAANTAVADAFSTDFTRGLPR
ncbi:hypothetical protein [Actinokineospora bangkokensis]|uniref:Uncharacterized protein n=1 Tax=Actinokineospora bangkokensis TaxID=1193682 RepID=A0A1Q9LLH6_9PSEU|nr:hypothetical protein [Actinokineospora bangkokensis]OLR92888.1 hypothetical protein BJP25_18090 [Actinokineospora bangkokensis]